MTSQGGGLNENYEYFLRNMDIRDTYSNRGFESHPLRHFNGPAKHAGWGENPFGEPRGEQAMPIGIGPSGPERSAANPILSATFERGSEAQRP